VGKSLGGGLSPATRRFVTPDVKAAILDEGQSNADLRNP
jgi:hypothetical protein